MAGRAVPADAGVQRSATRARGEPALTLGTLPLEVIEHVLEHLGARDIARVNAASRALRGASAGRGTAAERVLRARARERGHELPRALPCGARTWTDELLCRELVWEGAQAHALLADASNSGTREPFSAFVDVRERALYTCGETGGFTAEAPAAPMASAHAGPAVLTPTLVGSLSAVRLSAVAAGASHLLALSERGAVYVCGGQPDLQGALGLGPDVLVVDSPTVIPALAAEHVVAIAAGAVHSLALTAAGVAYSWGENQHWGQLGVGDFRLHWEPRRLEAPGGSRVAGIAAGAVHTLLLSAEGHVYASGCARFGRLGLGPAWELSVLAAEPSPVRVEALAGVRAVHVSAGAYHSLVVDEAGGVYSFGLGSAALGHGDLACQHVPKRIDALRGVRARSASAGFQTSIVLDERGGVHAFGQGVRGVLGHAEAAERDVPARVEALAGRRIVSCSQGGAHSLFVDADGTVLSCGRASAALGRGMSRTHVGGRATAPGWQSTCPTPAPVPDVVCRRRDGPAHLT